MSVIPKGSRFVIGKEFGNLDWIEHERLSRIRTEFAKGIARQCVAMDIMAKAFVNKLPTDPTKDC